MIGAGISPRNYLNFFDSILERAPAKKKALELKKLDLLAGLKSIENCEVMLHELERTLEELRPQLEEATQQASEITEIVVENTEKVNEQLNHPVQL